jgi:hypothetical protein
MPAAAEPPTVTKRTNLRITDGEITFGGRKLFLVPVSIGISCLGCGSDESDTTHSTATSGGAKLRHRNRLHLRLTR